jgi:hypothetical protein
MIRAEPSGTDDSNETGTGTDLLPMMKDLQEVALIRNYGPRICIVQEQHGGSQQEANEHHRERANPRPQGSALQNGCHRLCARCME